MCVMIVCDAYVRAHQVSTILNRHDKNHKRSIDEKKNFVDKI